MWWSTAPNNCGLNVSMRLTGCNVDIILKLQACTWQHELSLGATPLAAKHWLDNSDPQIAQPRAATDSPGQQPYKPAGDPLTLDVTGVQGRKWMLGMFRKMESISGTLGSSRVERGAFAVYRPFCA